MRKIVRKIKSDDSSIVDGIRELTFLSSPPTNSGEIPRAIQESGSRAFCVITQIVSFLLWVLEILPTIHVLSVNSLIRLARVQLIRPEVHKTEFLLGIIENISIHYSLNILFWRKNKSNSYYIMRSNVWKQVVSSGRHN